MTLKDLNNPKIIKAETDGRKIIERAHIKAENVMASAISPLARGKIFSVPLYGSQKLLCFAFLAPNEDGRVLAVMTDTDGTGQFYIEPAVLLDAEIVEDCGSEVISNA